MSRLPKSVAVGIEWIAKFEREWFPVRTNLRAGRAEASEGRQGAVAGIRQRDPGVDPNVVSVTSGSGEDRSRQNADVLEKDALARWYPPERLATAAARRSFLLPDPAR